MQVNRQAVRQTGRQADKQTDRQTGRQTDKQTGRQTGRQTDRKTGSQTSRQTDRQSYRQTLKIVIYSVDGIIHSLNKYFCHSAIGKYTDFFCDNLISETPLRVTHLDFFFFKWLEVTMDT